MLNIWYYIYIRDLHQANTLVDLVKPSRQFTCCSYSPSYNLNREHNSTVFTVYSQHTSALTRQLRQGNMSYK